MAYPSTKTYHDLDLNFTAHPNTKKLNILTGEQSIKRAVRNLILTEHNERPFHPDLGSSVTSYLFENADTRTATKIQHEIESVLNNYEPRINLNRVSVHVSPDQHGFYVTLYYFIERVPAEQVSELFLERVR